MGLSYSQSAAVLLNQGQQTVFIAQALAVVTTFLPVLLNTPQEVAKGETSPQLHPPQERKQVQLLAGLLQSLQKVKLL